MDDNARDDRLNPCGCCDPAIPEPSIDNAPGLPALAYRIGTHGAFLGRMLAQLPRQGIEDAPGQIRYPLSRLSTRSTDDPAIALLDAWATVGDVLTFYQERIANEGFLRTATERRSILELARLIGYELNPGVAASAYLAFSVDTAQGAPASATVAAGTKVQSVPGQNELPQTFETGEDMTARVEWNALRPRQMRPQELGLNGGKLYLLGLSVGVGSGATALDAAQTHPLDGDAPLPASGTVQGVEVNTIFVDGAATNLKAGDVILLVGRQASGTTTQTLVKTVLRVVEENALNRTRVEFDAATPASAGYKFAAQIAASSGIHQVFQNAQSVDQVIVGQTWSDSALTAWMSVQGWSANSALGYIYGAYNNPKPKAQLPSSAPGAFAMRAKLGFFGHNAPAFSSLTATAQTPFVNWDDSGGLSIWKNSLKPGSGTAASYYDAADCFLERSVNGITNNSWAVFELPPHQFTVFRVKNAAESSLAGYSLSAKLTGLTLATADTGATLDDTTTDKSESFKVRKASAHVLNDRLILAQLPIEDPLGKATAEGTQLTLDRMVLSLKEGQPVTLSGERDDLPGVVVSEAVVLDKVQHSGGFTTLFFKSPGLKFRYVRKTVTMNANVALATHGETVREVLGSGDGAQPNQRFILKKPPLTYVASSGATGAQSTLDVRIDGVVWEESPRLFGLGPESESYLVRIADDGKVSVIFGDGEQGARLPGGVENVTAVYRSGIGLPGMVGAGKLTLLMTRPLGISGVTNPLPASGAADPESRDDARINAPLTVLAMGRVVSLQDAEDFARAFAGIGKARAIALWRNGVRWIHLTVASTAAVPSDDGTVTAMSDHRVDATSPLGLNLVAAIAAAKDPSLRVRVDTYQPLFFNLSANVLIDKRYLWADVEAAIKSALNAAFVFERRAFGQPVTVAEVIRLVQAVPGVVFVDVDALNRFDQPTSLPPDNALRAEDVAWGEDEVEPGSLAQLLLINPLGIALTPVAQEAVK